MGADKKVNLGILGSEKPGVVAAQGPGGGLLVAKVEKFSSAAKAGIAVGDELLALNGTAVHTDQEALALAQALGVGGHLKAEIVRAGKKMELPIRLIEKKTLNFELDEVDLVLERKIAP